MSARGEEPEMEAECCLLALILEERRLWRWVLLLQVLWILRCQSLRAGDAKEWPLALFVLEPPVASEPANRVPEAPDESHAAFRPEEWQVWLIVQSTLHSFPPRFPGVIDTEINCKIT